MKVKKPGIFRPNGLILPPSVNWYSSSPLTCSESGLFAFAALNGVFVYDYRTQQCVAQIHPNQGKVLQVQFCHQFATSNCRLIILSANNYVSVWDLNSYLSISSHKPDKMECTCMSVSKCSKGVVFLGGVGGNIEMWASDGNKTAQKVMAQALSQNISCIDSSPYDPDIIAIGYSKGDVVVYNYKLNKILFHKTPSTSEITSIIWTSQNTAPVLVWASKNWSLGLITYNTAKSSYEAPPFKYHSGKKGDVHGGFAFLHPIPNSTKFCSTSPNGIVQYWDVSTFTPPSSLKPYGSFQGHTRTIFGLSGLPHSPDSLISSSMDRNIILWQQSSSANYKTISTLGGIVGSMHFCPTDSSFLALGCIDKMVRFWNVDDAAKLLKKVTLDSQAHNTEQVASVYETTSIWQGISSPVSIVRFHPNSSSLAFGTINGSVGYVDTSKDANPVKIVVSESDSILDLVWLPAPSQKPSAVSNLMEIDDSIKLAHHVQEENEPSYLLSITSTGTATFRPAAKLSDKTSLESYFSSGNIKDTALALILERTGKQLSELPKASSASFNKYHSTLAVGHRDGTLIVYMYPHLDKVLDVTRMHNSIITKTAYLEVNGSQQTLLATASDDKTIVIWNQTSSRISESYHLVGHKKAISDIAWSSTGTLLASCSPEGIRIWNLQSNSQYSCNLIQESSSAEIIALSFWPQNLDILFFSTSTQSVQAIQLSTASSTTESAQVGSKMDLSFNYSSTSQTTVSQKSQQKNVQPKNGYDQKQPSKTPDRIVIDGNFKLEVLSASKVSSFAGLSNIALQAMGDFKVDGMDLVNHHPATNIWTHPPQSVQAAIQHHRLTTELSDSIPYLDYLSGDIVDVLKAVTQSGKLNDMWVALAASGGASLWKDVCSAYSQQLLSQGDTYKAVMYLLAIRDVEQAIQVYMDSYMFEDAMILASSRLPASHKLFNAILTAWTNSCIHRGNHGPAAHLAVASGQIQVAIGQLNAIGTFEAFRTAFILHLSSNLPDFSESWKSLKGLLQFYFVPLVAEVNELNIPVLKYEQAYPFAELNDVFQFAAHKKRNDIVGMILLMLQAWYHDVMAPLGSCGDVASDCKSWLEKWTEWSDTKFPHRKKPPTHIMKMLNPARWATIGRLADFLETTDQIGECVNTWRQNILTDTESDALPLLTFWLCASFWHIEPREETQSDFTQLAALFVQLLSSRTYTSFFYKNLMKESITTHERLTEYYCDYIGSSNAIMEELIPLGSTPKTKVGIEAARTAFAKDAHKLLKRHNLDACLSKKRERVDSENDDMMVCSKRQKAEEASRSSDQPHQSIPIPNDKSINVEENLRILDSMSWIPTELSRAQKSESRLRHRIFMKILPGYESRHESGSIFRSWKHDVLNLILCSPDKDIAEFWIDVWRNLDLEYS